MKTNVRLFAVIGYAFFLVEFMIAQVPSRFSYQAIIRNNEGKVLENQYVSLRISILQGSVYGESSFIETHAQFTNTFGLINLIIGDGTVLYGSIDQIDWSRGPYFIKIEVDLKGQSDFVEFGTTQLLSVPYALYAKTSGDYKNLLSRIKNIEKLLSIVDTAEVNDVDGNSYRTIRIGSQIWMADDLKTTRYNDSTLIPYVAESFAWVNLESPAYCYFNNDSTYRDPYGALYNFYAVNTGKLCPNNWHVPSDEDWIIMEMELGMSTEQAYELGWRGTTEGGKLKESGTNYWYEPNTGATNESGFTALPSGLRDNSIGTFYYLGTYGHYWTSTATTETEAWDRDVMYENSQIFRYANSKKYGFTVRCVKD